MRKISPQTYPSGFQYLLVFVDNFLIPALTYPMKTKDETRHCLEKFLISARNLLGKDAKVCYLRSDQGMEYTSGYTAEILLREGIEQQLDCPDTPQHNEVAERIQPNYS